MPTRSPVASVASWIVRRHLSNGYPRLHPSGRSLWAEIENTAQILKLHQWQLLSRPFNPQTTEILPQSAPPRPVAPCLTRGLAFLLRHSF